MTVSQRLGKVAVAGHWAAVWAAAREGLWALGRSVSCSLVGLLSG